MEEFQTWPSSLTNYNPVLSFSASSSISQEEEEEETRTINSSFNSLESKNDNNNNNNTSLITPKKLIIVLSAKTKKTAHIINCLAVRNNALYAASAREVNVFDPKTLRPTGTLGPVSGLAKSITFGGVADDEKIFTAHQDRKIRVWNKHHRLVSTLPTLRDRAFNCMLPKSYVRVRRHELRRLWVEHADAVSGLAVDEGAGLMYSVSWDKCLKIWRFSRNGPRCLESVEAHSDAVNVVVVGPVDGRVYTGSADGEIKIWAARGGETRRRRRGGYELVTTLRDHGSSVNALAVTGGDGSGFLCSGGGDGVILVWGSDVKSGYSVDCRLEGHKGAVLCLVHVSGVLVSGSSDRTVRIWGFGGKDCNNDFRGCLAILEGHCKPVKALVAIPDDDDLDDGLSIFSGSLDGEIRAWKIKTISHPTI